MASRRQTLIVAGLLLGVWLSWVNAAVFEALQRVGIGHDIGMPLWELGEAAWRLVVLGLAIKLLWKDNTFAQSPTRPLLALFAVPALLVADGVIAWSVGGYTPVEALQALPDDWSQCAALGAGCALPMVAMLARSAVEEVLRFAVFVLAAALGRSTGAAVAVSAVMFAAYHVYMGPSDYVVAVLVGGLGYSLVMGLTRSIWPVLVAHLVANTVWWLGVQ